MARLTFFSRHGSKSTASNGNDVLWWEKLKGKLNKELENNEINGGTIGRKISAQHFLLLQE
jgi:hypothetical protein